MNIIYDYALQKMRREKCIMSLPPLYSGFKKLPKLIWLAWGGTVIQDILMVDSSKGYSFFYLLIFFMLSFLIVPVLTYILSYDLASQHVKALVRSVKITRWVNFVSKTIFLVLLLSSTCLLLDIPYLNSYIIAPFLFVVLIATLWIKFREEVKLLACARGIILSKHLYNMHLYGFEKKIDQDEMVDINPATGMPMINPAIDVLGNTRGSGKVDFQSFESFEFTAHTDYSLVHASSNVNPSTGLPMLDNTTDIHGNTWGSSVQDFNDPHDNISFRDR